MAPVFADYPLLKKIIMNYNQKILQNNIKEGSYKGEQGILRIRPETGQSLGMKVHMDQDYLDSRELLKKGEKYLDRAISAMITKQKERFPGEHVRKTIDHFLLYKKTMASANKKLMAYHSRLKPAVDDRLNKEICINVMDRLIEKSLKKTGYQLRDTLAHFYNICEGKDKKNHPLTPENVGFVNAVFNQFIEKASKKKLKMFDLDRVDGNTKNKRVSFSKLMDVIEKKGARNVFLLEEVFKKSDVKTYAIHPLLFVALMKRESSFNPQAVSRSGAAGLTQIMPQTALDLGMKNIYMPKYFKKALSLREQQRETRREAMNFLFQITEKNRSHYGGQARKLMQRSLRLKKKNERLFARYKKELLKIGKDDRLKPGQSLKYGYKYFATLLKENKGDISLALASYNAGPHRVRQYKGIPPYTQTVQFRNLILEYYRNYLKKAGESP